MFRVPPKITPPPMQNLTFFAILLLCCAACRPEDATGRSVDDLDGWISEVRHTFAPDRRTDRVEVTVAQRGDTTYLTGYTTRPEAYARLRALADSLPGTAVNLRLLPRADLSAPYGLIRVSVANMRTEPGHSSELTSQALLGTPVDLLDLEDGWYLVRTPDRYIAWLEQGALTPVTRAEIEAWFAGDLRTCVPAQATVTHTPGGARILSELVAGDLLQATGQQRGDYVEVRLPDNRGGWVAREALVPYADLAYPAGLQVDALLATAYAQEGRPYLWGGTSPKAMDCSGFTKTAYYLNGYVIPRDASQQVHAGKEIPLDGEFSQLQRGDLLFFGNLREDGSERITHVGFYLGAGRFLHAGADNDFITENSLVAGDADFAEHRLKSLLRARRLREGDVGVVPVAEAFRALYTRSSSR